MNKPRLSQARLAVAGAALLILAACGGGGGGSADSAAAPAAGTPTAGGTDAGSAAATGAGSGSATGASSGSASGSGSGSGSGATGAGSGGAPAVVTMTSVPITVVDGPIRNATVCVDKNLNGACESDETSGRTDASGNVTLSVSSDDLGRYPIVAVVGTDAVDADHGPITVPYTMKAPADQRAVVSPLTTLVQAHIETAGVSSSAAETFVREQTGLQVSLFADFTKAQGSDPNAANASTVARLVVVTTQEQLRTLSTVVNQPDSSGATITRTDLEKAVAGALLQALPSLGAAATDPAITGAVSRDDALRSRALSIVGSELGLDAAKAAADIGLAKIYAAEANAAAPAPTATGVLRAFSYTDPQNWSYRALLSSVADNTPDANGLTRFYDLRTRNVGGAVTTWGFNSDPLRQGDLHWNGSAWVGCPLGTRSTTSPRDSQGYNAYDYCDGHEKGVGKRATVDVPGVSIRDVVAKIRAVPGSDSGVAFANFGPADLAALGTALMPAGAKLIYQSNVSLATAIAYDVQASAVVNRVNADVGAGGDTRLNPGVACGSVTGSTPASNYSTSTTTLEALAEVNVGVPCLFSPNTNVDGTSLGRNEAWGLSTLPIGTVPNAMTRPAGTGNYYTTSAALRVAFDAGGNTVRWYSCYVRNADGSSRNCTQVGTGTWSIATLGDARVMSFANPPALAARLNQDRVFVERGGKVYLGYKVKPTTYNTVRLNLEGANALLTQLGLAPLVPN